MSKEVCGGHSPWKGRIEVVRATLDLWGRGIDVAGKSEEEVLRMQADLSRGPVDQDPKLLDK